jgi:membrane fusion protein, heavy metal efflux system
MSARRAWRGRNAVIAILLAAGAAAVACREAGEKTSGTAAPKAAGDRIEFPADSPQLDAFKSEPARESVGAPLTVTGRITWDEDVTTRILPPLSGRVLNLAAPAGARVRRDQLLAEISSPDFGQAQADAARSEADLAAAERARERLARLHERGAAARKDLEAAETDLARARAEARRTRERLLSWGGSLTSAAGQIYRLRSPLAGIVVERNVNPGQEVRPDAASPLFVVTDPTRLWVLLDVTERDLPAIGKGDRLSITCIAYPQRKFAGKIDWIGNSLDPATRTVRVRGSVKDPSSSLKAEMYVTVEDTGQGAHSAVVVPVSAVLTEGGRPFCFLQESRNRFRRVRIEVGPARDGKVPVLAGLSKGDRVVTEGSLFLSALLPGEPGA